MKISVKLITLLFISCILSSQELTENNLSYLDSLPPEVKADVQQRIDKKNTTQNLSLEEPESVILDQETESEIFGFDYFNLIPTTFSPTSDLPIPNDYIVGIGDVFEISYLGGSKQNFTTKVTLNGSLNLNEFGEVNVYNLPLEKAKERINEKISSMSIGLSPIVTLKDLSMIKVNILGASKAPGTYLINPLSTVLNTLLISNGVMDGGSLRNIEIVQQNNTKTLDLYDFLIYGKAFSDIQLRSGDSIIIKGQTKLVDVSGSVNRPKIYEVKESETIDDLIKFSLGLSPDAKRDELIIEYRDQNRLVKESISFSANKEKSIAGIERIYVPKMTTQYLDNVTVYGETIKDHTIPLSNERNEKILLNQALKDISFSKDFYSLMSVVKRGRESNGGLVFFNIYDSKTMDNVTLLPGDSIYFFSLQDLIDIEEYLYNIDALDESEIKTPEDVENENEIIVERKKLNFHFSPIRSNDSPILENILLQNFSKRDLEMIDDNRMSVFFGDEEYLVHAVGDIKVNSLVNYVGIKEDLIRKDGFIFSSNLEASSKKLTLNSVIYASKNSSLTIPKINESLNMVTITGEVNYPGKFKVGEGTTLKELYTLAGGLKDNADQKSIFFSREELKENERIFLEKFKDDLVSALVSQITSGSNVQNVEIIIDYINSLSEIEPTGRLSGDLGFNSLSSMGLVLEDGDEIYVPNQMDYVNIVGEVQSPLTIAYQNNFQVSDYIQAAGGITSDAEKSDIYIIRSNGTSVSLDRSLFSGKTYYPEKGDTIVVPRNFKQIQAIDILRTSTNVIADLAIASASLNALSK